MNALLVDGLNLVRRIHAAVPGDPDTPEHAEGVLRSCTRSLQRALSRLSPTHALCAFDAPGASWRHALKPDYKAKRPPMPEDLSRMMPLIQDAFGEHAVHCVRVEGFEADDVLATIAVKIAAHHGECEILSTDKSMLSLLRPGIRVRNHFEDRDLDEAYVRQRFGVAPRQLPGYLALVGDSASNIPGVRSVGAKTAAALIAEHDDLEAVLQAAQEMPGRIGRMLREGAGDARLSMRLVSLDTAVKVGINLNECRIGEVSR